VEQEMGKKIPGVLSEDALEGVSGGVALTGKTVGFGTTCEHFSCCFCGCGKSDPQETKHVCEPNGREYMDSVCAYCNYNQGSMHAGTCTYGL